MRSPESSIIILFICILVFLGIFLVLLFLIFLKRKNKLVQEQLETKLESQKHQHQLELKALRGQMNPHFVHNSLNAIQYYIQLNEVEKSEAYLAKFSRLMRQFFEYSRKQSISLENEIKLINNYLDIEKLRFEDDLDFKIKTDQRLELEDVFLPPMIIQPILENAINHGIFHKKGKGLLNIEFEFINEDSFKVIVIDNGIGIKASKQLNKDKVKTHTEHSTFVLEERLALLKESKKWNVDFTITDRLETEKETGTRVTLVFNYRIDEN